MSDSGEMGGPTLEEQGLSPLSEVKTTPPVIDISLKDAVLPASPPEASNDQGSSREIPGEEAEVDIDNLQPSEVAAGSLLVAQRIIKEQSQTGLLNEEQQRAATIALSVDADQSSQLKAVSAILRTLPGQEATDLRKRFEENQAILDSSGKRYTAAEWSAHLSSLPLDQRQLLEQQATYGYDFGEDSETSFSEANQLIETTMENLERQIQVAESNGQNTKALEQQFTLLNVALVANGEAGVLLKQHALQTVGESLPGDAATVTEQVTEAQTKLNTFLEGHGFTADKIQETTAMIANGDIDGLVKSGNLDQVEGLDRFVFGAELSEEILQDLLDSNTLPPEIKSKIDIKGNAKAAGLILLVVALAPLLVVSKMTQ